MIAGRREARLSVQTLGKPGDQRGSVVGAPGGAIGGRSPAADVPAEAGDTAGTFVGVTELLAMAPAGRAVAVAAVANASVNAVSPPASSPTTSAAKASTGSPAPVGAVQAGEAIEGDWLALDELDRLATDHATTQPAPPPVLAVTSPPTPRTASLPASSGDDADWGGTFLAVEQLLDHTADDAPAALPAPAPVPSDLASEFATADPVTDDVNQDLDSLLWQNADHAFYGEFSSPEQLTGEVEVTPPDVAPAATETSTPAPSPIPVAQAEPAAAAPTANEAAPSAPTTPSPPATAASPPAPDQAAPPDSNGDTPAPPPRSAMRAALATPRIAIDLGDRSMRRLCHLVNGPIRRCPASWRPTVGWVAAMLLVQGVGFTLWGVLQ